MATIYGSQLDTRTAAAEHNAQIRARFQQLQSIVRGQCEEIGANVSNSAVLTPDRPVEAPVQAPVTNTYATTLSATTMDRVVERPVEVVEPVVQAPIAEVAQPEVQSQESIQLMRFAKVFFSICAVVATALICLISVFTQMISGNEMKIGAMEAQNAQLRTEYTRVMDELDQATSSEAIQAFADANGLLKK